jgi:hypothetical protein
MINRRSGLGIAILVFCCNVSGAFRVCAQPSDQSAGTLANPLEAQPLDRLSATRDRPLFSPSRRPVPPPPPSPSPPVEQAPVAVIPPPPNVTLVGIVMDDDGARALIRSSATKADRVQIGDDIGGWKVSQIEGRRLVLSLDGRFATFTLFSNENSQQLPRDDGQTGNATGQAAQESAPQTSETQPTPSRRRRRH